MGAADWTVRGQEDFAWFGYSLHGVQVDNRTLLLVGSPTWKNNRWVETPGVRQSGACCDGGPERDRGEDFLSFQGKVTALGQVSLFKTNSHK